VSIVIVSLASLYHSVLSLSVAALRMCRRVVELKDKIFNSHIIFMNLFGPILDTLMANGRYNLVNSAILEFFEYINKVCVCTLVVLLLLFVVIVFVCCCFFVFSS